MAAAKVDKQAHERQLDSMFPVDTVKGILALLNNVHHVRELRYWGDYDASNLLLDLEHSMTRAKLTRRQRQVLDLVYEEDLTQTEAARRLGVSQQAVNDHILSAARKIAKYNRKAERREREKEKGKEGDTDD